MIPEVPDHPTLLAVIALGMQALIALSVAYSGYIGYRNNVLGHVNGAKIDAVHDLANGTTTKLAGALATEQTKNALLQQQLATQTSAPSAVESPTDTKGSP